MVKKYGKDESGAIALVIALLMLVFAGFLAVVIDVGYMYSVRRQLQAAADGAALAGCQTLINGGDEAEVLDEARLYAEEYNATNPGDGLTMIMAVPLTEVTDKYVKVTVEKNTGLLFARLLGRDSQLIRAQAVAERVYLTGAKGIIPWGVPVIKATRVTAKIGGGAEVDLTYNGSKWEGYLNAPSTPTGGRGVPITVTAYNDQKLIWPDGVPEVVEQAGMVVVAESSATISNVYLDPSYVRSDHSGSINLFVESSEVPTASFDKKPYTFSHVSGNLYKASLPVPATDKTIDYFPVEVSAGGTTIRDAAVLVVRRSTYPITDIAIGRSFFTSGTGNRVRVEVELADLVPEQLYDLKITSGSESGNFMALDFSEIYHPPYYRNPDPSEGMPPNEWDYYTYLLETYPNVIHIGDIIWTETGNLSGPRTRKSLEARFAGYDETFYEWDALKRPYSGRRVCVPIVEKVDISTGKSPVRVVTLAAFYIEPDSDLQKGNIRGRFVEYEVPGEYSETPPEYGLYLETPRLTKEHLDF